MSSRDDEIERLQRRLERERRARRQAEIIAERGMRELWEANSDLRQRVGTRTARLECSIRSFELTERARSLAVDRIVKRAATGAGRHGEDPTVVLSHVRSLLSPATSTSTERPSIEIDPVDFGDRLLERWQHPAARAAQLLSVEVDEDAYPVAGDWALVQALADTLLAGCLRHAGPGALSVSVTAGTDGVGVSIRDSGPRLDARAVEAARRQPGAWSDLGPIGDRFALVDALAAAGAVDWSVESDDAGTVTSVSVAAAG